MIGITTDRFWTMTYVEVSDEIEAFNHRLEAEIQLQMRSQAQLDYQLAQLIGAAISDPKKYPRTLQKAYPNLFKSSAQSWQASKEQFQKFADEHNRQRKEADMGDC